MSQYAELTISALPFEAGRTVAPVRWTVTESAARAARRVTRFFAAGQLGCPVAPELGRLTGARC